MSAFYVLEVGLPGRPKCPDEFEDGENSPGVLICPGSKLLIVQISAKAAFVQLGIMDKGAGSFIGSVDWQTPRSWMPTAFALPRKFDAVRVRNYTAGEEAQITLEAI